MNYYKLRTDLQVSLSSVLQVMDAYTHFYCYCLEGEFENSHAHFYLEMITKEATLRSNLRKIGLKGNGAYSLKALDSQYPVAYLAYLTKAGRIKGFDKLPLQVYSEVKSYDQKVKDEIKAKKEEKKSIMVRLSEVCQDYVSPWRETKIKEAILQFHIDNDLLVRKFQCQAYYDTLMVRNKSFDISVPHIFI